MNEEKEIQKEPSTDIAMQTDEANTLDKHHSKMPNWAKVILFVMYVAFVLLYFANHT